MIDVLQEPNWIVVTFVGAVVGALVSRYGGIVTYPFRTRLDAEGRWFVYHYTFRQDVSVFIKGRMRIRKGTLGGTRVRFTERNSTQRMRYIGHARREGNDLVMLLKIMESGGSLTIRLRGFASPHNDTMVGLWLSYDVTGQVPHGVAS